MSHWSPYCVGVDGLAARPTPRKEVVLGIALMWIVLGFGILWMVVSTILFVFLHLKPGWRSQLVQLSSGLYTCICSGAALGLVSG